MHYYKERTTTAWIFLQATILSSAKNLQYLYWYDSIQNKQINPKKSYETDNICKVWNLFLTKLQKLCNTALTNFGSRLIYYGPPLVGKLLFSPSKLASIIVLYGKLTFSPSKRAYLVYISPWYIHSYVFSRSGWNLCSGWSLLAMFYTPWGRLGFCSAWARYCWDFIVLLKLFFHIFDGLLVGQLSTKKCKYINHRNGLRG